MKRNESIIIVGVLCYTSMIEAKVYTFSTDYIGESVDISRFNQGGQLPGTYTVDILLNGGKIDSRDIVFFEKKDTLGLLKLEPCVSIDLLSSYDVKVESFPGLSAEEGRDSCAHLSAIPNANFEFSFNKQELHLSIPQIALRKKVQGIAAQERWDDGISTFLLNYQANASQTENHGSSAANMSSQFVQLQPGANIGAWRLRNSTNWRQSEGQKGKWQTSYTYAERGMYNLKSRLTLGERSSASEIFDSVPFRGVMLGSDDAMVPANQRTFAPVIRGIARTQALIEVKQNGYTVYSTTVAPGPFAIDDLSVSSGSGSDLQVTVLENDGNTQAFTVPYSTPVIALREGYLAYNLMAGNYRPSDSSVHTSAVGQVTVMYGLPWDLTVYGGLQGAENYKAASLGLGWSLGRWGALSLDSALANSVRYNDSSESGHTLRVRYGKSLEATNTNFHLVSTQYTSKGYNTLSNVLDSYRDDNIGQAYYYDNIKNKTRYTVTVNQSLGEWGSLSINGSKESHWNDSRKDNSLGISYNTTFHSASLSFNWSKNKHVQSSGEIHTDNISSLWISMPLNDWFGGNARANYQFNSSSNKSSTQRVGLNGTSFDREMSWGINQSYQSGSKTTDSNSSAATISFNRSYGIFGGNYSYSPSSRHIGADIAGGMVIHNNGVTLTQPLGDTMALIEAPGVQGIPVGGYPGVKTDFRGYTVQSFLLPYQENTISLDPSNTPINTEITQTDTKVVPTQGALVTAKFATQLGGRAIITLTQSNGSPVPFGALAIVEGKDNSTSVVGDNGEVYLTGLQEEGEISVMWKKNQCKLKYKLPEKTNRAGTYLIKKTCN
ncbi:fimbria/pilus outer membrane usher protein [Serratia sp. N21D137]|uniref:fimbria/pilus outer membrane usher protein n=1 Tax=Serratia sp. N21D137 TaxID=3397495 RepID=UPI0039E19208